MTFKSDVNDILGKTITGFVIRAPREDRQSATHIGGQIFLCFNDGSSVEFYSTAFIQTAHPLQRNLHEIHNYMNDVMKPYFLGWIDPVTGKSISRWGADFEADHTCAC